MTTPELIVLHDDDNVGTALRSLEGGGPARVAGVHGDLAPLELLGPIPMGHKAALRQISEGDLVMKHGHPIGRATSDIAPGDHVHIHNVISLSRERQDSVR
jgi:altronate dehydratase